MKPHKHAELIKQWADGAEIQIYKDNLDKWTDITTPSWDKFRVYRVKPKVKWTPKYKLEAYEYKNIHPKPALEKNNLSDDIKKYWKLTKFVEEFETDWNNQDCEVLLTKSRKEYIILFTLNAPLGTIVMSKKCADKLCEMLNNGEIEL